MKCVTSRSKVWKKNIAHICRDSSWLELWVPNHEYEWPNWTTRLVFIMSYACYLRVLWCLAKKLSPIADLSVLATLGGAWQSIEWNLSWKRVCEGQLMTGNHNLAGRLRRQRIRTVKRAFKGTSLLISKSWSHLLILKPASRSFLSSVGGFTRRGFAQRASLVLPKFCSKRSDKI